MSSVPHSAWGKRTRGEGAQAAELSLLDHCADVAAVLVELLHINTIRVRIETIAGRALIEADIARLGCLALWHDIGKANLGFWSQRLGDAEGAALRRRAGLEAMDRGHTAIVATLLRHYATRAKFAVAFPWQELTNWGDGAVDLLWASISHHGTPLYCQIRGTGLCGIEGRLTNLPGAWQAQDGYDPLAELRILGEAGRRWFPGAFSTDCQALPYTEAFVHAFAGLVSLADWIASNPKEGFFPYESGHSGDRMDFARSQARTVLFRMRIDVESVRDELQKHASSFGEAFFNADTGQPFVASGMQNAMARTDLGQIVVLESETGSGKTEAALWRFATLFAGGEVDSLAFLLPTRVAATSLKLRVEKFLRDLFKCDHPPLNCVLGVPGYIYADGQEAEGRLADFETLWPDNPDEDAAHRRWASEHPKRCFAAAVMIGTVDQALLGVLRVRHAHLRGSALLRSLLVVDEVHASDAYMTGLLEEVLDRHIRAGGHAVLLSATLGGRTRERLLRVGTPSQRLRPGQSAAAATDFSGAPYPALSDRNGVRVSTPVLAQKRIQIEIDRSIQDPAAFVRIASQAARDGARVLLIRNTVGTAMEAQEAIETQLTDALHLLFRVKDVQAMHHGRYAGPDRRILDARVEEVLGKSAARAHGLVLIGTQTLEQSLDIDADLLITDLAPADVLLQRFGRLHRHKRDRPPDYEVPRAVVLAPPEGLDAFLTRRRGQPTHGFGTTYTNLPSLRATLEALEARTFVSVPADCRALVEAAVDEERLQALCEKWGGSWPEAWQTATGRTRSEANEAHHAKLDWRQPWGEQPFPNRAEERLRTRLGGDDRLVDLPERWKSPFGADLAQMKLPDWMLWGVNPNLPGEDRSAAIVEQTRTHILFDWGGLRFLYDRLGLRRVDAEREPAP